MAQTAVTEVAIEDVLAAWAVLENLAASLDQMGSTCRSAAGHDPEQQRLWQDALAACVTPALVQSINAARMRLGQYITEDAAEALSAHIPYWDYATLPKETGRAE